MTSDLSSTLEVCFKQDVLNKSMFTLLYFTLQDRGREGKGSRRDGKGGGRGGGEGVHELRKMTPWPCHQMAGYGPDIKAGHLYLIHKLPTY